MQPEELEYAGWKNCLRLSNGTVELVVTLDVGPRVIRFGHVEGQNLFKQFEDQVGRTGGDGWRSYGGHRLWHAPEVEPRTYFPDNRPVAHDWDGASLTLTPPEEESNHIQLAMEVTLDASEPRVTLNHRVTNTGVWEVELAPWSLSVMAGGGRAIIPQEAFIAHGDSYSPARPLVLWSFADMSDPRFTWGRKYVQLREDPSIPTKQKFGARNTRGWAAYLLNGEVFIKRFPCREGVTYPDFGCNCEFYTEPGFLEMETLGPLTRIAPGDTTTHPERWQIHRSDLDDSEASLDLNLLPLVEDRPAG